VARRSFLAAILGTLLLVPVALGLLVPVALGQDSSERVQRAAGGRVQGEISGGGSLPFTSLDFVLLIGGGLALLAFGLAIRRLSRERG
jgi:hypothetical protein